MAATPGALVEQLTFNVSPGQTSNPLTQASVRQAIAMCIDAQAVAEAAWRGLAGLAGSYLPPGHPLFREDGFAPDHRSRCGTGDAGGSRLGDGR